MRIPTLGGLVLLGLASLVACSSGSHSSMNMGTTSGASTAPTNTHASTAPTTTGSSTAPTSSHSTAPTTSSSTARATTASIVSAFYGRHHLHAQHAVTVAPVPSQSPTGSGWAAVTSGIVPLPAGTLIDPGTVTLVVIDPTNSQVVFAEALTGLYKTTDGGRNWIETGGGLNAYPSGMGSAPFDQFVSAIVIDPQAPETVYVGASGGVAKSTDGGNTWALLFQPPYLSSILWLVMDPTSSMTLYSGDDMGDVSKTTDGGTTWNAIGATTFGSNIVQSLVVDPFTPDTLIASTSTGMGPIGGPPPTLGLWKSTDGGATWASATNGFPGGPLAADPNTQDVFYGAAIQGVWKTEDGGQTWAKIAPQNASQVIVDPTNSLVLYSTYAFPGSGVMKSKDGGATWATIDIGLPSFPSSSPATPDTVSWLAIDPKYTYVLYAATGQGVYGTTSGGE